MAEGIEVGIYNQDSVQWIRDMQGEVAKLEGKIKTLESTISTLNSTTSKTEKNAEKTKKGQQEIKDTASSLLKTLDALCKSFETKARLTKQNSERDKEYRTSINAINAAAKITQLETLGVIKGNTSMAKSLRSLIITIGALKDEIESYYTRMKEQAKAEKESEKTALSAQKAEQSRIETKEKVIMSLRNESMATKEVLNVSKSNNLTYNETKTILNDVLKLKNKGISIDSAYVSGLVNEVKNIRNAKNSLDEYYVSLKKVEQVKKDIASKYPSSEVDWISRMSNVAKSAGGMGAASRAAVRSNPGYYYAMYTANQSHGGLNGIYASPALPNAKAISEEVAALRRIGTNRYFRNAFGENIDLSLKSSPTNIIGREASILLASMNQQKEGNAVYARRQQSVNNPINIALPGLSSAERQTLLTDAMYAFDDNEVYQKTLERMQIDARNQEQIARQKKLSQQRQNLYARSEARARALESDESEAYQNTLEGMEINARNQEQIARQKRLNQQRQDLYAKSEARARELENQNLQQRAYNEAYARRQQSVSNPINIALPGLSMSERQTLLSDAMYAFDDHDAYQNALEQMNANARNQELLARQRRLSQQRQSLYARSEARAIEQEARNAQLRAGNEAYARYNASRNQSVIASPDLPGLSLRERQNLRQDAYVAFATPQILHNAQITRFNGYSTVPFNTVGGAVANSLWQRSATGRAIGLNVNRYGASNRFSSAPVAQMESGSENDSLSRLQLIMAYFGGGKVRELAQEYSQFKSALSSAEAVIGANADEMVRLQASAEELGKNTVFTAGQAAEGIKYLGMAGMKTNEIVKVLPETLNLASAGELDLGRAADIATNIMSSFNMEASEFKVAADAIAYAAANSNTNVEQLALGMKYAGPSARAAGVSLKDTTAVLSTLANAGIQASTGGTSLRMVLSSLSKAPTKSAIKALREMGLEFEDVSLKNNELISVINKLAERNMSLGQAIDIFGVRAANSMMALTSNTDKLNQMEKGLDGCAGAAKRIADIKMDNLSGDFTILTSAVSNAVIQFTKLTGAEKIARETFQSITKYINATSDSLEKFMKWAGMVPSEVTKVNKSTGEVTTAIQGITESGKFLNATMQTGVEIVGTIMGMNIANWVVKRVADIDLIRGAVERATKGLGGLRDLWNNVLHDTQGRFLTNQAGGLSGAKLALAAPMITYGLIKVGQIFAEVIKTESVERDTQNIAYKNSQELLSMANTPTGYDEKMINLLGLNGMFPTGDETHTQFFKRAYGVATSPYASPGLKEFARLYEERDNFRANYAQQINDKKLNAKAEASARETIIRFFKKSYNAISDNITEGFDYAKAIEEVASPLREQKKINDFIAQNKGTALLPVEIANESDLKILSDVGKGMGKSLEEMLSSNFPSIVELRKLLGADYVAPKSGSKTATQEKDTSGNGFIRRVADLAMGAYGYGLRKVMPYASSVSDFNDVYMNSVLSNNEQKNKIGVIDSVTNQSAYDKKMKTYEMELEIRNKIREAGVSEGSEAANLIRAQIELRYQLNELEEKGMERMRKSEEIYRNLSSGIADAVVNAHNLRDAFQSMGDVAVNMLKRLAAEWAESQLYKMFTRAGDKGGTGSSDSWGWIGSAVGGLTKIFGFANGGALQNGRLTAYARGGIVNRPTIFPMAHGMGLMGEAGAEAVMPLRRTASGDLGVQVSGGSSRGSLVIAPQITINAEGGSKDENKDAAERIDSTVRQALDDMVMNVIIREQRPGGTLYR